MVFIVWEAHGPAQGRAKSRSKIQFDSGTPSEPELSAFGRIWGSTGEPILVQLGVILGVGFWSRFWSGFSERLRGPAA